MTDVENKLTSLKYFPDDPNSVISEINERDKRESKVVILNVPESVKPVDADRRQDDIDKIAAILKSQPADNSDIKFKPSLTQAQQLHLNAVRAELDQITQSGITNKTIKYINGIPRIVNKPNFRPSKEKNKNKEN